MPRNIPISRVHCDFPESSRMSSWLQNVTEQLAKHQESKANIINQVNYIMRNPPRYATVDDAVLDMRERTGLNKYLENIKASSRKENGLLSRSAAKNIVAQISGVSNVPEVWKKYSQEDIDILVNFIENIVENSRGLSASIPQVQHDILHTFGGKYHDDDILNEETAKYINNIISIAKAKNGPIKTDLNIGRGVGQDLQDNQDYWSAMMPAK